MVLTLSYENQFCFQSISNWVSKINYYMNTIGKAKDSMIAVLQLAIYQTLFSDKWFMFNEIFWGNASKYSILFE